MKLGLTRLTCSKASVLTIANASSWLPSRGRRDKHLCCQCTQQLGQTIGKHKLATILQKAHSMDFKVDLGRLRRIIKSSHLTMLQKKYQNKLK